MLWTMYNDQGQLSLNGYTEEEARQLLEVDTTGNVYAMNPVGDTIETHDGPITVARVKDDSQSD